MVRKSEHAGDHMICSEMRLIWMCESVRGHAYNIQGIQDFSIPLVHIYGASEIRGKHDKNE